jgi:hypothetical protein
VQLEERLGEKMFSIRSIPVVLGAVLIIASTVSPAHAQDPTPFANCRLGAGGVTSSLTGYDLGQLNLGLYTDWATRDPLPADLPADVEYIQTVRLHQDKVCATRNCVGAYVDPPSYSVWPRLDKLAERAANQPGMLWLIGNEIDRRDWESGGSSGGQDEITAELYATAFHEIRDVIKTADPTAKIAIAGVIQATPLRLEYLDRIWDSYQSQYGYPMGNDIDVWNVHGFVLREVRYSWGAETPPGIDTLGGFLYGASDQTCYDAHHDIAYFQQFIEAFRAWMAEHGEQDKPLLISEYGILFPEWTGISTDDIKAFMVSSFDYLFTAQDEDIGYPADENRLVQGWIWFSLNEGVYWPAGKLFDPTTKSLTEVGNHWKDYVSDPANPLASLPQRNLLVTNLRATPNPVPVPPGGSRSVTLRVDVANSGNTKTATGDNIVVNFWDGVPDAPGSNIIASATIEDVPGCGLFRTTVEAEWQIGSPGDHTWYAEVEPFAEEPTTSDNIDSDVVSAFESGGMVYLPLIIR